ncbi:MAG: hypothetical protein WCF20_10105 [Methylovirgula sp.]
MFVPYSGLHLVSVIASIIIIATTVLLGRALCSKKAGANLRRAIAILSACYFVVYNVWWNWEGNGRCRGQDGENPGRKVGFAVGIAGKAHLVAVQLMAWRKTALLAWRDCDHREREEMTLSRNSNRDTPSLRISLTAMAKHWTPPHLLVISLGHSR